MRCSIPSRVALAGEEFEAALQRRKEGYFSPGHKKCVLIEGESCLKSRRLICFVRGGSIMLCLLFSPPFFFLSSFDNVEGRENPRFFLSSFFLLPRGPGLLISSFQFQPRLRRESNREKISRQKNKGARREEKKSGGRKLHFPPSREYFESEASVRFFDEIRRGSAGSFYCYSATV